MWGTQAVPLSKRNSPLSFCRRRPRCPHLPPHHTYTPGKSEAAGTWRAANSLLGVVLNMRVADEVIDFCHDRVREFAMLGSGRVVTFENILEGTGHIARLRAAWQRLLLVVLLLCRGLDER
jgi:hypothetical protein